MMNGDGDDEEGVEEELNIADDDSSTINGSDDAMREEVDGFPPTITVATTGKM